MQRRLVRHLAVLVALMMTVTACGPDTAAEQPVVLDDATPSSSSSTSASTAMAYFTALAELDYDEMAQLSTGVANTAARYGQQVIAADPNAFSARDLMIIEPLAPVPGDEVLEGALDLTSKGFTGPPLRISQIEMRQTADGSLVSSYARDGRGLDEVFRDLDVSVRVQDVEIVADLVLTDPIEGTVLLPVTITAGAADVTVDPTTTRLGSGGPPLDEGAGEIPAGATRVIALSFRDVADPSATMTVDLGLLVGDTPVVVELPVS